MLKSLEAAANVATIMEFLATNSELLWTVFGIAFFFILYRCVASIVHRLGTFILNNTSGIIQWGGKNVRKR